MKLTCPNNPDHKRFQATVHVTQLWVIDERGNWVENLTECDEVTHGPHADDVIICHDCEDETHAVAEDEP